MFQVDNVDVQIVSVTGGWTTVQYKDGTTKKVRNSHVVEVKVKKEASKIAKIKETQIDLSRYFVSDQKTPSGRKTIDCNDEIGVELRGRAIDEVYTVAAERLGTTVDALRSQYGHLNVGMQRMNLGNRIRGAGPAQQKVAAKLQRAAEREEAAQARAIERARIDAEKAEAKRLRDAELVAKRAAKKAVEEVAIA
jgi:hypothetical protein